MGLKASQFSLTTGAAKNFPNVEFNVTDGKLTIAKRQIWRITPDGHKNYDGAALVRKGDLNANKNIDPQHKNDDDGFVDGEGFAGKDNFTWTEDAVLPGEYDNVVKNISYRNGTNRDNYDVHIAYGKLKIDKPSESEKHEITITANSSLNNKYDGKNHSAAGFTTSNLSFTTEYGVVTYRLENVETSNPTKKDAGKYDNIITKNGVKVFDEKGHDVTELVKLKFVDGKLVIQQRNVTLVSESKKFEYNGNNHSCEKVGVDSASDGFVEGEGVTYKDFATIKNVGTKENFFDFDWDTAAERNYVITKRFGVLSVTKGDISKYVTLKTVDVSEDYDGNRHIAGEATATDENGNDLKIEYQKSDGTWTTNRNDVYAVNVDDSGIVNVRVSSPDNYGEGNYVTGTEKLAVNPVAITLTAKSDSKPYDGIALTNNGYDVTKGKFVGDEGLDSVTVSGSQTEVGRSDNLITAYALKKNTKADNYDITAATGALEVIPSEKAVVVKIKGNTDTQKYNGNVQSVSGYTVAGVTVDGKDSKLYGAEAGTDFTFSGNATATRTDAGTTNMGLAADQFNNINKNFSNVTFEVEDGSMTITKREVTLTSANDKKPYDGTALTNSKVTVSGDGFVSGQGFKANVTGSQTNAGSSLNTFTYELTGVTKDENDNYDITVAPGTLTVNPITDLVTVTIVGNHESGTYNGEELKAKGYTFASDNKLYTLDKVTFSGTDEAARTDAGTTEMGLNGKFANADTTNFKNVKFEVTDGYVDIAKAPVTLKSRDLSKPYDGTPLTNGETALETETGFAEGEGATYTFTGSQTIVGSSANAFSYTLKPNTNKDNYKFTKSEGTLAVTNREAKYEITVKAKSNTATYNGEPHFAKGLKQDEFTVEGNKYTVSGLTTEDPTKTDAGTYTNNITGTAVVKDADKNDVTDQFEVTTENGSLVIGRAPVTMKSASDKWTYDGNEHTKHDMEFVKGFADGEGATISYTGAITNVGEAKNTFTYKLNKGTNPDNYTIADPEYGTLKVNPVSDKVTVTIKGKEDTKPYNGEEQSVTGYDFSADNDLYTQNCVGFTGEATAKGIAVGTYNMNLASEQFSNTSANFTKVEFVVNDGSLTITGGEIDQSGVKWTLNNLQKKYDGNTYKAGTATAKDKFGNALKVEYSVDGKNWTGDPSTITAKNYNDSKLIQLRATGDNYKDGEYAYSSEPEQLIIGQRLLTMTSAVGSKKYDGTPLVKNSQSDVVVTGDGFAKGEGATYDITGSQTEAGTSKNTFTYSLNDGTLPENYRITCEPGTLTVTANDSEVVVTIKGNSATKTYTGQPQSVEGYKVVSISNDKYTSNDFELKGAAKAERSGEGTTYMGLSENSFVNKSANFSKVTFQVTDGYITIKPKSIVPDPKDPDNTMSVETPKNVVYNGQVQQQKPVVKDGEKTLAEGTDYTVAYGKDDFTNVTGEIKVTVTGKGNYAGSVERTYQITPAPLTVKTEGATKVYDGEALTHDAATIKGLKNKETATIHATGSQIEVGESDNGYAITWDGSAQKDNYTIKTETIGKLVVSETADQITATPANVETTYDGNAHGTTVQVTGLPKGYTVKKAESKATATDVADGEVKTAVDELVIVNAQGKDVTSKLNIKRGTATIKINPAPLTVTTDGGEKEYDGTALTANGIKVEGLKGKDSVSAKTTGSRTKVGSSNNTYEISWKDTKKSNYKVTDVLGTLKVTPSTKAVTLTSGSASHAYSGHALTNDEIKAEGLPEGFTVKAKMDGAQTDAGSSENTVKSYKILDAKGDDVTGMFANVTVKTGTLTVSPKKITVETEGATKVYDGEELTNENGAIHGLVSGEHADVVTNGTQTNVGSSDNGYTIAWGTAKEGNYTIASDTLGKLVVTPQSVNPNDPSYHKLQVSNPADLTYDGQTHKWAPEVKDYTGTELKEGVDYTLAYDTDDLINAGSITVTVVGKGNYTGTVSRTYRIKPAPVSIKTESAARVYNGKALTAGGAITGLVNGETVDFRVTGSQTKVGHSANTYKLAWTGTAREANYTVDSVETGTLTVTESEDTVVVTTTGGTFTYDGNAHGATVAVSQLPEGYTVDGTPSSDATATDANGDGVKATVDHLVIRNAEGEDVTPKLNIKKVDGTIKVLPVELTVTTDSATKVYDGTALTAGATVTGLVGDEEATLEATGKQTQVGSSSNGYKLTFDKTAKDKNYKVVSENLGTLTVTKQSIVPSEPGTPSDNYKGVTVDDPKDAVYDGVEHKWTPVVEDAEGKTLVEGTDYVVSYDTDDFIDVATINVTITGKGNYAGTIAKSYRITKAPLHVVTGSATKVFDGQALTSATVTIDGLAERDRIGIAVTGSQTNVGSSQNTYAIDWMQTSADNYELTDELGTLTVTAAPARPTTPTTPVTPTTPTTPTVPNPTPNSSDGGSTTTTAAPTGEDSATGNDQEQKEEKVFDAKNPLGKFDGKKDTCWVHWYMIVCAVATAAYGLFVGLRRDKHGRRLQNDLDKVLGDDETQE